MKRRRTLTAEERALWRQVAASTRRRAAPGPVIETEADTAMPAPAADVGYEKPPLPPPRTETLKPYGRAEPAISLPATPRPSSSGLDKRTEARLRKGKRDPDARIDLHGMTANRARAALIRFVTESRMAGRRCVLVITGKGAPDAPRDFGDPTPGVIRREAPHWLSAPPLAQMVVNVSQAHPRHGGAGALYVYLKRIR
ncbi:MAG: Smr/MutS family protein [Pseudomonadota bacterium]